MRQQTPTERGLGADSQNLGKDKTGWPGLFCKPCFLPIPAATPAQQAAIAGQVQAILAAKAADPAADPADPAADTAAAEAAVDAAVAALYGVVLPGAAAGGH